MPITHSASAITITGSETGDTLRAYMNTNNLETRLFDDLIFTTRSLVLAASATLTASNCMLAFSGAAVWFNVGGGATLNFNNVIIRAIGDTNSIQAMVSASAILNFTNSFYVIDATQGNRIDFFSPASQTHNFVNTALVHDGNGFMHLFGSIATKNVYTGVTAEVDGGIVIQYADFIDCIFKFPLGQIFNDAATAGQPTTFTRLSWDRTVWAFGRNDAVGGAKFINPRKPAGWTAYGGFVNNGGGVREVFTHDIRVLNTSGVGILGAAIKLTDNTRSVVIYSDTTNASGVITQKEVQTYSNVNGYSSSFTLGIWAYGRQIVIQSRPFSTTGSEINETVILVDDTSITELVQATVQAYVSCDTAAKFYDLAANHAMVNQLSTIAVTRSGDTINAGSRNVTIDAAAASVFAIDGSGNITIKAATFTGNIVTTGSVSLLNGAQIAGFTDTAAGTTSFVRIT